MRVAILYICTGPYSIFWKQFFDSAQQFLLPGTEKYYFVFTDNTAIVPGGNVRVIHQAHLGFPHGTLIRFDLFLEIEEPLRKFDYIYFFNSNMHFVAPVGSEIIPVNSNPGLVGTIHPGYYKSHPIWFPYERNPDSTAFFERKSGRYRYFMGGLNGGTSEAFLKLSRECSRNIHFDLENNIIAVYHDESHLNCYFADKDVLELSPSYGYPEGWELPFVPKIIIMNKILHGGEYFNKFPNRSFIEKFRNRAKQLMGGVFWYLKLHDSANPDGKP